MPGRVRSGTGRVARRGASSPVVPVVVVLAFALLMAVLWWRSHLSGAEARVQQAIAARLARASTAAADPVERALRRFYERRGKAPAWSDGRRPNVAALACVDLLRGAAAEGLDANDYADSTLAGEVTRTGAPGSRGLLPDADRLAGLDLALTRGFLRYARDVHDGRLPRGALDPAWAADRDTLDLVRRLRHALDGPLAAGERPDLAPEREDYRRLREGLARYRAIAAAGGWRALPPGPVLQRGAVGAGVLALRRRLAAEGDSTGSSPEFDATLASALRAFQERHGLRPSGRLDEPTRAALDVGAAERARQISMNLERERWLPAVLREPHVVVNVPDFHLELRDSGRTVLRSRVVVGEPRNPTPIFSAKLSTIVLNPTWRLPRRIVFEETVPAFRRDTSWLRRHHMRVFYTRAAKRLEVPPHRVDWRAAEEDTFSYLVVQDPGDENPLGRIKLMCPNPHDVYLHDTPAKGYFSAAVRAYSHGCVRVQKARGLAEWLLARDTLAAERANVWRGRARPRDVRDSMDAVFDSLVTRSVTLRERVPVHFLYRTAWVDSAGAVQFRRDLYGFDRRLGQALRHGRTADFVLNPPVEWGVKHRSTPAAPAGQTAPLREVPPERLPD
jgi:murein L,D-transpeptidase YcbB/YkuD